MGKTPITLAISFLIALGSTAHAQFNSIGSGFVDAGISGAVMQGVIKQSKEQGASSSPDDLNATQQDSLLFTPTEQQRQRNYAHFVANTRVIDEAAADQLEKDFARNDIIALAEQPLTKLGFDTSNIADSYAFWLVTTWLATQGRSDDQSPATLEAVRKQVAAAFATVPDVLSASDAAKQQAAEAYVLQGILISVTLEAAKSDSGKLESVKTAVKQGALAAAVDLEALSLTEAGFVLKP